MREEVIGGQRLILGDCRDYISEFSAIDLLLTDIPYNISQESNGLRNLHYGDWDTKQHDPLDVVAMWLSKVTGTACVFLHETQLSRAIDVLESNSFTTRSFVWHKPNPTVLNGQHLFVPSVELAAWGKKPRAYYSGNCLHNWLECTAPSGDDRCHPTPDTKTAIADVILH